MAVRKALYLCLLALPSACSDRLPMDPLGAAPLNINQDIGTLAVPEAIAKAGCAVGREMTRYSSKAIPVSRKELPFALPALDRVPVTKSRHESFTVVRMSAGRGSEKHLVVACIVPLGASDASLRRLVQNVPDEKWRDVERQISASSQREVGVSQGLFLALREGYFPTFLRDEQSKPSKGVRAWGTGCPSPCPITGVNIIADPNSSIIDYVIMDSFFKFGDNGYHTVDVAYYIEQEWQHDCNSYNQAWQNWYATRDQVIANANKVANDLYALADKLDQGANAIASQASCQHVPGKSICIDFFIMDCSIAGFLGDCRGFDSSATFAHSRVQAYIDPVTLFKTTRWGTSSIAGPNNSALITFKDTALVYNEGRDFKVDSIAPGHFILHMSFNNIACGYLFDNTPSGQIQCPSITAEVEFIADASSPEGWMVRTVRDGMPSMGVYKDVGNNVFRKIMEDPQTAHNGIEAIRALAGDIIQSANNSPPPVQPENCFQQ